MLAIIISKLISVNSFLSDMPNKILANISGQIHHQFSHESAHAAMDVVAGPHPATKERSNDNYNHTLVCKDTPIYVLKISPADIGFLQISKECYLNGICKRQHAY